MGSGSSDPNPSSSATEQGEPGRWEEACSRHARAGRELWFGTALGSCHMRRHWEPNTVSQNSSNEKNNA